MMTSQVRQNFHQECEAGINKQINWELVSHYTFLSMSHYFQRDDVALPGLAAYFKHEADEEMQEAEKLMKYQNVRGGRVVLQEVRKPAKDEWGTPLEAMEYALDVEKKENQGLLNLHKLAAQHSDNHFTDFLESALMEEAVDEIKEICDYIAQLKRVGAGLGEYLFDKDLLEHMKKENKA